MCTTQQHTLLPSHLQFCTRCPKCLADLCFSETPTSYSSVEVRCPVCSLQFSHDVPQNMPHYNFSNIEDNMRFNANCPATAQDAKTILPTAKHQILSLALNDPTCRPSTHREEALYNLEGQINAALGLTVLAALPIGTFFAIINVIPWMGLLVWPLLLCVLLFWTRVASPSIFRSGWRSKPMCQVSHLVVVDISTGAIHKLPFSEKNNIMEVVTSTKKFRVENGAGQAS